MSETCVNIHSSYEEKEKRTLKIFNKEREPNTIDFLSYKTSLYIHRVSNKRDSNTYRFKKLFWRSISFNRILLSRNDKNCEVTVGIKIVFISQHCTRELLLLARIPFCRNIESEAITRDSDKS